MNKKNILKQIHSHTYTLDPFLKRNLISQWYLPEMNQRQKSHVFLIFHNLLESWCKKDLLSCYLTYKWSQKYIETHLNIL